MKRMFLVCTCGASVDANDYRDPVCPSCGVVVVATERPCPKCELPMTRRQVIDVALDECRHCAGLFLDHASITNVLADHDHERAEAMLALPQQPPSDRPPPAASTMCPTCRVTMTKAMSQGGAGIVFEVCKAHGAFFDAGEVAKIIEYARRNPEYRQVARYQRDEVREYVEVPLRFGWYTVF